MRNGPLSILGTIAISSFLLFSGCAPAPLKSSLSDQDVGKIAFQSITIDDQDFFQGTGEGTPVRISGFLQIPNSAGKLPAVVITHGGGGVREGELNWAKEINRMGFAAFVVDSFTDRGIGKTATGGQSLGTGSSIIDVYRALELLSTHPRIDASRIALMGFSRGGRITLNASMLRFQKKRLSEDVSFAGYLSFYPAFLAELQEEENIGSKPVRIFQGLADDWTTPERSRFFIEKLRKAGKDAAIYEYPKAHHRFDDARLIQEFFIADALNFSDCNFQETAIGGSWVDLATGETLSAHASCVRRGATICYNVAAHRQAKKDVEQFLFSILNIGHPDK
jgi:dienelactone hydrolase